MKPTSKIVDFILSHSLKNMTTPQKHSLSLSLFLKEALQCIFSTYFVILMRLTSLYCKSWMARNLSSSSRFENTTITLPLKVLSFLALRRIKRLSILPCFSKNSNSESKVESWGKPFCNNQEYEILLWLHYHNILIQIYFNCWWICW